MRTRRHEAAETELGHGAAMRPEAVDAALRRIVAAPEPAAEAAARLSGTLDPMALEKAIAREVKGLSQREATALGVLLGRAVLEPFEGIIRDTLRGGTSEADRRRRHRQLQAEPEAVRSELEALRERVGSSRPRSPAALRVQKLHEQGFTDPEIAALESAAGWSSTSDDPDDPEAARQRVHKLRARLPKQRT